MAMMAPDRFMGRARRAYEWSRVKHAALYSSVALVLTAVSSAVCQESTWSLAIGGGLFALATGLMWRGGVATRAARAGLKAGMLAFAVPVFIFHGFFDIHCGIETILIVNAIAGLGAGILLSIQSARLESQRNAFLLGAAPVVLLSGTLGCLLFGPVGVASMAIGYLASTAPVMVYHGAMA